MSSDEESVVLPPEDEGGKEIYPYGEYEGGRDDQLERHGFGSALLPNSDIYEGNYLHGRRHGIGMYCFKNGARYYGEWKKVRHACNTSALFASENDITFRDETSGTEGITVNHGPSAWQQFTPGMKHGNGVFYYPDGSRYEGKWKKDMKHGHGFYYYPNGDVYEGNYYKNQRTGLGSYKYASVKVVISGVWKNGQLNGPGIIRYVPYQFHGTIEKNLPKGPGCFTFDGKYILHGFYLNIRDPSFDYVGAAEELDLGGGNREEDNDEDSSQPIKGIVPIWRTRHMTPYKEELLPAEPEDFPRPETPDSMMDIIEYLQKQYGEGQKVSPEEEADEHRRTTTPVPADLLIDDEVQTIPPGNIDV